MLNLCLATLTRRYTVPRMISGADMKGCPDTSSPKKTGLYLMRFPRDAFLRSSVALSFAAVFILYATAATAGPVYTRDGPFNADTVIEIARKLSKSSYVPPKSSLPSFFAKLTYDQYRDIRFRRSATFWVGHRRMFRLQLLPMGYLFKIPVEIAVVKGNKARHLPYRSSLFKTGKLVPKPLPDEDIGFSGFRLLYPLNHPGRFDEVAVYQGAS